MNKSRLLGAVFATVISFISMSSHAAPVSGQGTWETTLQARDFDGDTKTIEGWYDMVLGITWLADADVNGLMSWEEANAWTASISFGAGLDNWRLPTMVDTGTPGCDWAFTGTDCGYNVQTTSGSPPYPAATVYSEMASMFYETLGNKGDSDTSGNSPQPGWGLTNTGPFNNLQDDYYWSGLEYAPNPLWAWFFIFDHGAQDFSFKSDEGYAWAVHDGAVGAAIVPIPPALYLFGSCLLGLAGMVRKKA